jgi:arsenate reductase (thioredoxin)
MRRPWEVCPVWPGHPATAHWGFPDPLSAQGTDAEKAVFTADVFRQIERRLQAFSLQAFSLQAFMHLPIGSLDRLCLKQKLDELGRNPHGAAPGASRD